MSNFFGAADVTEFIEYATPDGEGYIRLRSELTKAEMNKLYQTSPQSDNDRVGVISFSEKLLETLFAGWSNTDEHGNEVEFNIKVFRTMGQKSAQWVEKTVGEHFRTITGAEVEELEKKPEE